jgi:hypothetical protein
MPVRTLACFGVAIAAVRALDELSAVATTLSNKSAVRAVIDIVDCPRSSVVAVTLTSITLTKPIPDFDAAAAAGGNPVGTT